MLIDRASTFRGKVADYAVSTTSKGGWPQFVCKLVATEIWDEEEHVWVDWTDMEQDEITAYNILYGSKGETLTFNQVKKVFNWDGTSFQALNDGDYSEIGIQFRVEQSEYQGKPQLKVNWIDEYDAVPGRSVKQLSSEDLQGLDAKYATFLKAGAGKAAPAKAPTVASGGKAGTVKAKGVKPTSPKGPVTKKATQTATEATVNTPPDEVAGAAVGSCTKQEAYDEIVAKKDKKTTDEQVAKAWGNAIKATGKKVDELADEDWFKVKITVLDEVAEIPF